MSRECVCNETFRTAEDYRDHLPCTEPARNTVTEYEYKSDHARVIDLARQPGGVSVVRADGSVKVHIWIPSDKLVCDDPDCVETRKRLAELTTMSDAAGPCYFEDRASAAIALDAALTCLRRLHDQLVRVGGYATHADQAELLEARMLLKEHGR